MVAETDGSAPQSRDRVPAAVLGARRLFIDLATDIRRYGFRSLPSRIVMFNILGLIILTAGILYLNQFQKGLTEARITSLRTQGEIIAAAVAGSATLDTDAITIDPDRLLELQAGEEIDPAEEEMDSLDFPLNPERVSPFLRHLLAGADVVARIYDRDGVLVVNSADLFGQSDILSFDLEPPEPEIDPWYLRLWRSAFDWLSGSALPLQRSFELDNGMEFPEIVRALQDEPTGTVRINENRETIVNVAVPIRRLNTVLGALVLTTKGGDIDGIVRAERTAIVRVFMVALAVAILSSVLLAAFIAAPVGRLARAAQRVRRGVQKRVEIPDLTMKKDEIGHLSGALRDMTEALYNRIDAIESFAADVAHELKNPLTSLNSAVETLPRVKDDAARARLIEIVHEDVNRLDRLISDISDASRLDAELARAEAERVNLVILMDTVVAIANELRKDQQAVITLDIENRPPDDIPFNVYTVMGHDIRLGQVLRNLIDNARSFSPDGGEVRVHARCEGDEVVITIDDDGPGVPPDNLQQIFRRFYTDRPEGEAFGKNSGLGLSISKQIVEAHDGQIWAENRHADADPDGDVIGARFVVRLPLWNPNTSER